MAPDNIVRVFQGKVSWKVFPMEEAGQWALESIFISLHYIHYYTRGSLLLTTFLPMKAKTPAVTSPANITNRQAKNCRGRRESHVSVACSWGLPASPSSSPGLNSPPQTRVPEDRSCQGRILVTFRQRGNGKDVAQRELHGKSEGNSREYITRALLHYASSAGGC